MTMRARGDVGRAPMYSCDAQGCCAQRACSCGVPKGWVEIESGSGLHLCTAHRDLQARHSSIVRTHGVRGYRQLVNKWPR